MNNYYLLKEQVHCFYCKTENCLLQTARKVFSNKNFNCNDLESEVNQIFSKNRNSEKCNGTLSSNYWLGPYLVLDIEHTKFHCI